MAQTLKVRNFACIEEADFRLAPLTVLIGPQASGKSILAKLANLFQDFVRGAGWQAFRGISAGDLNGELASRFLSWFPKQTWGDVDFDIEYSDADLRLRILNDSKKGELSVDIDDRIIDIYRSIHADYTKALESATEGLGQGDLLTKLQMPLLEQYRDALSAAGAAQPSTLFIPSGRSLFTSLAHTGVATFTESKTLDPVTRSFGSLVTSLRDVFQSVLASRMPDDAWKLLGGKIMREGSEDYLDTGDGRRVPLFLMSSGQQELYPLILSLGYSQLLNAGNSRTVFIEEPEAHLFPDAQTKLIEMMIKMGQDDRKGGSWVFTTHSPYCLSKVNNLIQAGRIAGRSADDANKVRQVVDESLWIKPEDAAIYAIRNRRLISLVDDEGQIDSEYLDAISSDISKEFGRLLEIEFGE